MDSLVQDVKFAARQLLKEKGFFVTTALTLALCIGANATIFAVVYSILLKPLPFHDADRLVSMANLYPGAGVEEGGSNGVPDYYDRRGLTDVFEEVAVYRRRGRSMELEGIPQRVATREVTPSLFPLLGASPIVGRAFEESDGEIGQNDVVILSHALWLQLSGGNESALGTTLRIDGEPHTIVGVMPRGFRFIDQEIRLWTPFAFTAEQRQAYHSNSWRMVARLAGGVTLEQAQSRVDALNAANMDKFPQMKPLLLDAGFHTRIEGFHDRLVKGVRSNLFLVWGGVAFVLLIGCVNVANLVLVRSTVRARELATRFALGASRRRVFQQVSTETVLLTLFGGALGLVFGLGAIRGLDSVGVAQMPLGGDVALDGVSVAFTFALALLVGLVVSVMPILALMRVELTSILREEGRGGTVGRGTGRLRKILVTAQIALAMMLLVGSGLLVVSFQRLLAVDPGFEVEGVLSGSVRLTEQSYPEGADRLSFIERSLERIRALPGVERAGTTGNLPFGGDYSDSVIFAEGYVMKPGESAISPSQTAVSPGFFETLGIRLVEGRFFDARDTTDSTRVMVVDERLAQRFWPDTSAIGKRMWLPDSQEDLLAPEESNFINIVGVVESIRMRALVSERDEVGAYYFPLSQSGRRSLDYAIKTSVDPSTLIPSVRRAMSELDPELPVFDIRSMENRIDESLVGQRTPMLLTAIFALSALGLAAVGIYGMLAYMVQIRTREIGIRVALGSSVGEIFGLVLRDGLIVVALGLLVGLAGSFGLSRVIASQLYGISPLDPFVLAAVAGLVGLVASLACTLPALRASRIEAHRALGDG